MFGLYRFWPASPCAKDKLWASELLKFAQVGPLASDACCRKNAPLTLSPSVLFLLRDALILSMQPVRAPRVTQETPGLPVLG